MKTISQRMMVATALLFTTANVMAANFTNIYTFTNTDAYGPHGLLLSGNTLFGTTGSGGSGHCGTVFKINTDGSGFANLHNFSGGDGVDPRGTLVLLDDTLYGTTFNGGIVGGYGTIFKIKTDGTSFTNLYCFHNTDGANPQAGVVVAGDTLYGTTITGDVSTPCLYGTIFRINTDGTGFTNLYVFSGNDGRFPYARLVVTSNTLYGTTRDGGDDFWGTVFRINTDGTGFTNLYAFNGDDGGAPYAGLILSGNALYGTTAGGGSNRDGSVFKINADGTGFTNLFFFNGTNGANPVGDLVLSDSFLYGTTASGGTNGGGTVFKINADGTNVTRLHDFGGSDGYNPNAGLVLSGNTLYGTTSQGGNNGGGTVFVLTIPPDPVPLTIQSIGNIMVLNWNDSRFILQVASEVGGPFTNLVGVASPYTNTITCSQMFFRLLAN